MLAQPGTRREFNGFVKDRLPRRTQHAEVTMRTSLSDQLEPDVQAGLSDSLKLTHINQIWALCPSEAPHAQFWVSRENGESSVGSS